MPKTIQIIKPVETENLEEALKNLSHSGGLIVVITKYDENNKAPTKEIPSKKVIQAIAGMTLAQHTGVCDKNFGQNDEEDVPQKPSYLGLSRTSKRQIFREIRTQCKKKKGYSKREFLFSLFLKKFLDFLGEKIIIGALIFIDFSNLKIGGNMPTPSSLPYSNGKIYENSIRIILLPVFSLQKPFTVVAIREMDPQKVHYAVIFHTLMKQQQGRFFHLSQQRHRRRRRRRY